MFYLCLVIRLGATDDDERLSGALLSLGIKAFFVSSTRAAGDLLAQFEFDVVLFSPEERTVEDIVDVLEKLASFGMPSVVLRHSPSENEQIRLLQAGALEVLPKKASTQLIAHKVMKAAQSQKRLSAGHVVELTVGPLKLDAHALIATVDGKQLPLTPRQFDLLFILASRAGKLIHRSELERMLSVGGGRQNKRALDMQLCRIRKCLRLNLKETVSIRSVYGFGYCLSIGGDGDGINVREALDTLPGRTETVAEPFIA